MRSTALSQTSFSPVTGGRSLKPGPKLELVAETPVNEQVPREQVVISGGSPAPKADPPLERQVGRSKVYADVEHSDQGTRRSVGVEREVNGGSVSFEVFDDPSMGHGGQIRFSMPVG